MNPAVGVLGLVLAYVAGSLPTAYLAGRMLKGVDLRRVGSGNLGATNVYRELGLAPALVVLGVDAAKGALPVMVLPALLVGNGIARASSPWWAVGFGAAAIAGHAKSVFLLWKGGGKGVATAGGVFAALAPGATLGAVAGFAAVVAATRLVSLGSIVAALLLPTFAWLGGQTTPVLIAACVVGALVVYLHRGNIARLRQGTEPRIGKPGGGTP